MLQSADFAAFARHGGDFLLTYILTQGKINIVVKILTDGCLYMSGE